MIANSNMNSDDLLKKIFVYMTEFIEAKEFSKTVTLLTKTRMPVG